MGAAPSDGGSALRLESCTPALQLTLGRSIPAVAKPPNLISLLISLAVLGLCFGFGGVSSPPKAVCGDVNPRRRNSARM